MGDLFGRCRKNHLVDARAIFANLLSRVDGLTLVRIGELMGKDHTTVLYYVQHRPLDHQRYRRIEKAYIEWRQLQDAPVSENTVQGVRG